MNTINYLEENWGKALLYTTAFLTALCVWIMISNLGKLVKKGDVDIAVKELSRRAQPLPHNKYENLIKSLSGTHASTGVHKKNIFSEPGKGELQPETSGESYDFSDLSIRFKISKVYKKPVQLLFKGYMQLGDSTYVATINWGGKTDFKKIGEEIRGYKIVDFKKSVSDEKTVWGGAEKVDKTMITLLRGKEEKFSLEIGKVALEKEIYAVILDRKDLRSYEIHIGSAFLDNKILDIFADKIIMVTSKGEEITLTR